MSQTRLPDGFAVQVDRRVRVLGQGSTLLGGSPTRLLRLAPAAQDMLADGRLKVHDAVSAELARTLLDATVAHPRPAGGPSHRDVTVVIPVRDNPCGLRRLVSALRGLRIIIVDDGSSATGRSRRFRGCPPRYRGAAPSPKAAGPRRRGTPVWPPVRPTSSRSWTPMSCPGEVGWRRCSVTSATRRSRWWRRASSGCHRATIWWPATRRSARRWTWVTREAPVLPYSTVSYVPSAAIICRTSALRDLSGFDETLRSGEDVDLCWRLVEAGARLRYEPIALVAHDHRTELKDWIARRAFYGGSAAPLAARHPDKTAPLVISGWGLAVWMLMAVGSCLGYLASLLAAALTGRKIAKAMHGEETQLSDIVVVALRGLWSAALQLASAICRHYWPVALIAAIFSRQCRRAVVIAAIVDGVVDWLSRRGDAEGDSRPIGLLSYLVLKRVDDLAYGLGLWSGVLRERNIGPLKPQIRT